MNTNISAVIAASDSSAIPTGRHRHQSDRHEQQQNNLRLSLPPPSPIPSFRSFPSTPSSASTPSKLRRPSSTSAATPITLPYLLILFLSLRSLYSLSPILSTSLPLLPFAFLLSLLSLLFSSLFPSPTNPFSSIPSLSSSLRSILFKSLLFTTSLLLRLHGLKLCGPFPTILGEFSGNLIARSLSKPAKRNAASRGVIFLFLSLLFLSFSWDRAGCFPLSLSSLSQMEGCSRVPMLMLPLFSGCFGFLERSTGNWISLRVIGRRQARLLSLAIATVVLFVLACFSLIVNEKRGIAVLSLGNTALPLLNFAIFVAVLSEKYAGDKGSKDFSREFLVTFLSTLVLELFYFPKLSLPGLLLCGLLMWLALRELVSSSLDHVELGSEDALESLNSMIMKPLRHILSERKSRKIALFLLINTAYMVVEFVAGFMSNSLGLISDACHMLFDCAALAIGLYATYLSRLPANNQFNYGRGRFEVLSGYVNAVFLVLVGALIVLESLERLLDPQEISPNSLLAVSVGGLAVNVIGLIFFHEEHHHAHGGSGSCSHSHSHHSHHREHHHHHHRHSHHHHRHDSCSSNDGLSSIHGHNILVDNTSSGKHFNEADDHTRDTDSNYLQNKKSKTDAKVVENHHDHQHSHQHLYHRHNDDNHVDSCGHNQEQPEGSAGVSYHHIDDHDHDKSHRYLEGFALNDSHPHSSDVKDASLEAKVPKGSHKRHHIDHNMQGIFLHVLADTMGSVGVVVSTLLIKYKGWLVADPACSIFISIMIISSVLPLLRNSSEILLQRVPRSHEEDIEVAIDDIMKIKGVTGIRNLHVWNFTNTDIVGTVHLHVSAACDKIFTRKRVLDVLEEAGVKDITIQIECIKV